jgi:hypothetical protein
MMSSRSGVGNHKDVERSAADGSGSGSVWISDDVGDAGT